MVADRGPDASDDIAARVLDGNGYVFGQSAGRCDPSPGRRALSDDGCGSGDGLEKKSRPGDKAITLRDRAGRVTDVQRAPAGLVAFRGARCARRAAAERGRAIERARRMVRSRASHGHTRAAGAGRHVREGKADPETGELARSVVGPGEEAVARDAETDGRCRVVTARGAGPPRRRSAPAATCGGSRSLSARSRGTYRRVPPASPPTPTYARTSSSATWRCWSCGSRGPTWGGGTRRPRAAPHEGELVARRLPHRPDRRDRVALRHGPGEEGLLEGRDQEGRRAGDKIPDPQARGRLDPLPIARGEKASGHVKGDRRPPPGAKVRTSASRQ